MIPTRWRPQPTSGPHAFSEGDCAEAEWQVVITGRAHVLIEGSKSALRQTIDRLVAELPRRVAWWSAHDPAPTSAHSVIVEDVATLTDAEQGALLALVSAPSGPRQIIATSSTRVYDAVVRRQFKAELYYHLNTVLLKVTEDPLNRCEATVSRDEGFIA